VQKYLKYFLLIVIIAFVIPQITLAAWWNPFSWGIWNRIFHFQRTEQQQEKLIGGDKDAHGCLIAAGYSWCEVKNKCLRSWEEKCEADQTAGWKTYTNNKYEFSIKYPKTWIINENEDGFNILNISNSQPPKNIKSCSKNYLGFKILKGAPYFGTEYISEAGIIEESEINGHKLIKTKLTNLSSDWGLCANSRYFLQTDQNNEYYIEIIFYGNNEVLNEILSTIKFRGITITSPKEGEVWKVGETHDITWKSENLNSDDVVNISIDDISDNKYSISHSYNIASNILANPGKFSWKIPDNIISSSAYVVGINCATKSCIGNRGNSFVINSLTVTQPTITSITSPGNISGQFHSGDKVTIKGKNLPTSGSIVLSYGEIYTTFQNNESSESITFTAPSKQPGAYNIWIQGPGQGRDWTVKTNIMTVNILK
jgi:hypothetical protein